MKNPLFISAVQSCLAFILACFYIFAGTLIANALTLGYISNRSYHLSAVISSLLGAFLLLLLCWFTLNIYKRFED